MLTGIRGATNKEKSAPHLQLGNWHIGKKGNFLFLSKLFQLTEEVYVGVVALINNDRDLFAKNSVCVDTMTLRTSQRKATSLCKQI